MYITLTSYQPRTVILDARTAHLAIRRAKLAKDLKRCNENKDDMFYSGQVEVIPEGPYVRWITNHVLRESEKEEIIRPTRRKLTRILNADSKGLNLFGEIVTGY